LLNKIIFIFILLVFAAFFAGSETAFVAANRFKLINLKKRGRKNAVVAYFLLEKPDRLFNTTLIGTNVCYVLAANLTAVLFFDIFQKSMPLLSILSITITSLILCEILPKNLAVMNSIKMTLLLAYPVYIIYFLFYPVGKVFSVLSNIFIRFFDVAHTGTIPRMFGKKEDVKIFLTTQLKRGVTKDDRKYFVDSLNFGEKQLSDIMVPLVEIRALQQDVTVEHSLQFINKFKKCYIPVFKDRIDNIVGVVYANELFSLEKNKKLSVIMHDAQFIPESKNINELYRELFVGDIPVVFAVDEYGGVTGMATLYDIGEEVIGEINIFEEKKSLFLKVKENEFLCTGDVDIDEINHRFSLNITQKDIFTLNGLILKKLGRIPRKGDSVAIDGFCFIVEKGSEKKAELVKIVIPKKT
jgi:CBS domain containing-hemolysin-like protein